MGDTVTMRYGWSLCKALIASERRIKATYTKLLENIIKQYIEFKII